MLWGTTNHIETEEFTHGWRDDGAFAMHGSQRGHSTAWARAYKKCGRGVVPRPLGLNMFTSQTLEVHVAHRWSSRRGLLRLLGNHCLGGDQQASD